MCYDRLEANSGSEVCKDDFSLLLKLFFQTEAVRFEVRWGCWWGGDVGGVGMLVRWGCWWSGDVGGVGMLVRWGCWWPGVVGRSVTNKGGQSRHR